MQELRFVAVSEDGSYAVLAVPGRSGRYILPIDERLRAVAQGQTSRLAQYEIEVESPLRPKEIQARIRAGETAEEIADAAGIPVERVRWFEGPVLAERAYIADQAQAGSVRRAGDSSGPGPRLGDIVTARLSAAGTDPADGQWDSRKRGDGNWQVSLTFPSGGRLHVAEWVFDSRRRHVMPDDDNAARLSLPESELPAEPVPMPGEATVTPIASRLGAAAGMGGGAGVSRFRPERSIIPDRSLGGDRSLADRPAPPAAPAPERTAVADRSAPSDRFAPERAAAPEHAAAAPPTAPPRPAQPDRPGYQGRTANPGYAEFPESAPYRAPGASPEPPPYRETAPEPPGYSDPAPAPAPEQPAYRAPVTERPVYSDDAPEPAAHRAPTIDEDSELMRTAPPRPVVFEDPEPAFADDLDPVPAQPAPAPPTPPATSPAAVLPAVAEPAPVAAPEIRRPEPTAATSAEPTVEAESAAAAAPEQMADVPGPAEPGTAEDQSARGRGGAKKSAKGRRSSVPSWDEIMLGSTRQRD
jgi:hypothetical protein